MIGLPSFQRSPTVRLRREGWGGIAFDRADGDLLELDDEGFAVLVALSVARTIRDVRDDLRARGFAARLPELGDFVKAMEGRGLVRLATARTPDLPPEPWAEAVPDAGDPLRGPIVAHWAVTYRCNLHCAFCYAESGPGREPGPGPDVRLRLVERLAGWGVLEVALGGGEPTILPDLPALLAAIRAAGMVPNVTTNGVALRPEALRALAEHAGVVHLSADREDLLDAARGAGVSARLRQSARRLRRAGARLGINLLLTPENVGDIRRSLDLAIDLDAEGVTFLRPKGRWAESQWPGFPSTADLVTLATDLRGFLAGRPPLRLSVDTALRGEWARLGLLDDPEPDVLGCGGGQRHVAITPEGDVYPCSHARRPGYRMGNLLVDEGRRLWPPGQDPPGRRGYLADCRGVRCPCSPERPDPRQPCP